MWPCQPSGRPSSCRTQSTTRSSSSVDAGDARQTIATWFSVAAISSARIPGSDAVTAKYEKKRGLLPVRERRNEQLVEVTEHVRRTAPAAPVRRGGSFADSSPGFTCASTGSSADPLEVARRPLERGRTVLAEVDARARFLCSFSSCFHVRVLTTSAFVSQPRRACADRRARRRPASEPRGRRRRRRASAPPPSRPARARRAGRAGRAGR